MRKNTQKTCWGMGEWWYFTNHHVCTLKRGYPTMPSQKKTPGVTSPDRHEVGFPQASLFSDTTGFPLIPQYVGTAQYVWAEYRVRVHSISYLSSSGSSSMNWPLNMALQMSSDTFFIVFLQPKQSAGAPPRRSGLDNFSWTQRLGKLVKITEACKKKRTIY